MMQLDAMKLDLGDSMFLMMCEWFTVERK